MSRLRTQREIVLARYPTPPRAKDPDEGSDAWWLALVLGLCLGMLFVQRWKIYRLEGQVKATLRLARDLSVRNMMLETLFTSNTLIPWTVSTNILDGHRIVIEMLPPERWIRPGVEHDGKLDL